MKPVLGSDTKSQLNLLVAYPYYKKGVTKVLEQNQGIIRLALDGGSVLIMTASKMLVACLMWLAWKRWNVEQLIAKRKAQ